MHIKKHAKRVPDEVTSLPSLAGFSGVASASAGVATSSLFLNTAASNSADSQTFQYSLVGGAVTLTSSQPSSSASATSSTETPSASAIAGVSHSSEPSIGTVIGICLGVFAGLAAVIIGYYLYSRRSFKPEGKDRNGQWDKLAEGEDKWEGAAPRSPGERELQEKNSQMFKKSSPSMRTTRTKVLADEHDGFNLPPLEFAKYHPGLAKELALEQPIRPYAAHRGESGISWDDGSTVREDSFLEMRSVRAESGAISPTLGFAKTTPAAEFSVHRWESAEVLTMGDENIEGPKEVQNPFTDVSEQRRSVANPFFNAQDMQRRPTRSRSNSRSNSRVSRARSVSESTSVSRPVSAHKYGHISNPFADIQEVPVYRVAPPDVFSHSHTDSVASGSSANVFGVHAMKSLIAALDLSPEEVEERLRVISMGGSINSSRLSGVSGVSATSAQDDDADAEIATVRAFPMPPPAAHIP
ncbi:hypothetical protein FOMPIDRAFT_1025511 [Fomitopsis schrenkii]|uniref:Uncharacterized protein n=1 Tax=Fomitopsis schrenkii TaxID=2126942 RepID=S8F2S4_FOMSC|nr:hypothetical protein FOMPIDRAFT_1025511 [Fomitopsis schrenkii]